MTVVTRSGVGEKGGLGGVVHRPPPVASRLQQVTEAARDMREQVAERLGADAATAAAQRGRHQPLAEVVDELLATLDALRREEAHATTATVSR